MAEQQRSFSESFRDTTDALVQELSGKGQTFRKKLIDNIAAFTSLSGGAGTTTIVANLAYLLAKDGFNILVIDLNICYPCIHLYYGLDQTKDTDLIRVVNGEKRFGDCLQYSTAGGRRITFLVPLNRLILDKSLNDTEQAGKNLDQLIEQAASLFDLVLIDLPTRGEVDYELSNVALFKSDFVYCVVDESIGCISSVTRFKKNLQSMGISIQNLHYIMNKRTDMFYPTKVFKQLDMRMESIIPYESGVIESALRGQVFLDKGSSTSRTAVQYVDTMNQLEKAVLRNGGYNEETTKKAKAKKKKKVVDEGDEG